MGLEKKAKTYGELNPIGKEQYCRGCYKKEAECPICFWNTKKYVGVSVAQQEIDGLWIQIKDHRKTIDRLETERKTLADFMERERGLQKQKLQQLIHQWDNQGHLGITIQETDWLLGEFGRLRKLAEELPE
jgi:hypothetical protein